MLMGRMKMIDAHGRKIEYLRLSVTQRCNLKCLYCNPAEADGCELLNPGQIEKIVGIMAQLGIRKVRLTGGEPLMCSDLEDIVKRLAGINGIDDLPLTTNGVGLETRIRRLHEAGVSRFNISLDSLDKVKYVRITGVNGFESVMRAVNRALELNISVKLNAVLMRGVNDDEIDDFINLAKHNPLEVRFIELMPIGDYGESNQDQVMKSEEILASRPYLQYIGEGVGGVAELYKASDFKGIVGFISPISHKFCHTCNRIRLTAEGTIKPCLGDNDEVPLAPLLNDESALYAAIENAIYTKPKGHCFDARYKSLRDMKRIGG